ncbi:MAG: hypothetical protein MI861_14710, partial [Pirellulales bacterium]|nr:hypothetical protein [Pirellulales bacterium]
MSHKDELQQSLLELHYDLLDEQEAARLRAAIQSDPEVAAEWAKTLRLAGKIADAAKLEKTKLPNVDLAGLVNTPPSRNGRLDSPVEPGPDPVGPDPVNPDPVVATVVEQPAPRQVASKKPAATAKSWWLRSGVVAAVAASIGFLVIGSWYMRNAPAEPQAVLRLQAQAST